MSEGKKVCWTVSESCGTELGPGLWLMDGFRKGMFKQSDAGCLGEEKDSRGATRVRPVSPHTQLHQSVVISECSEFKLILFYCVFHCFTQTCIQCIPHM